MKINTATVITDIEGNPIMDGDTPFVLARAARMCLLTDHPELDKAETGEAKFARWQLAKKLVEGEVEITVEEAALIKKRSAMVHTTTVYGRVCEALEG